MADAQNFSSEEQSPFPTFLTDELRNEEYYKYEGWFHAKGRGRRPDLPEAVPDVRLFLQLHLLRCVHNKTWRFVEELMERIFPFLGLRTTEFRGISDRVVRETMQLDLETEDLNEVLSRIALKENCLLKYLGPASVTRDDLLGDLGNFQRKAIENSYVVTNELLVKLERFRIAENLPRSKIFEWLNCLSVSCSSTRKGLKLVDSVVKKYQLLQKSKNKKEAFQERFTNFCQEIFKFDDSISNVIDDSISDCNIPVGPSPASAEATDDSNEAAEVPDSLIRLRQTLSEKAIKLKTLDVTVSTLEKEKEDLISNKNVLLEIVREKDAHIRRLGSTMEQETNSFEKLQCEFRVLKNKLSSVESELALSRARCSEMGQSAYYKRLERRDVELQKREASLSENVKQHSVGKCDSQIQALKTQLKSLQTVISNKRITYNVIQDELQKVKSERNALNATCDALSVEIHELEEGRKNVQTKSEGRFTDPVVKTYIELMGEAEVPAGRCSDVVRIVSRHMFDVNFAENALPSERTALRFADQGHVLSKYHIAESLKNTEGWDSHVDGTTKDHRKFLGHQINLSSGGTMSAGFTNVFTEDTSTLLDVAVNLLQELSEVYDEANSEEHLKDMLRKLVATMGDRASVMKSYSKALDEKRQEILSTDDTTTCRLEFLHCNAHFLLGMSTICDQTFQGIVKDIGPVGRDKLSVFRNWGSKESPTTRYIRTACDCFGPRGDEKSGCKDSWLAYCSMNSINSEVGSFRSNRFNNYFQGAAALYFHRTAIIDFLNLRENNNLKLKSVLADAQCEHIASFIQALGILYFRVTEPYWRLVTSNTHYLDFYKYIDKMHSSFMDWSQDASPLLSKDSDPLFPDFPTASTPVYNHLYKKVEVSVKERLQLLCSALVVVTKRQLSDFLPEGRYFNIQDPDLRAKMDHCKLTNLIGEACFGDLGFSIFKRRNASLHHHSTINMLKRNRTMSRWFSSKSDREQKDLLKMSSQKGAGMRKKHKAVEIEVQENAKRHLDLCQTNRLEKQNKLAEKKRAITEKVRGHGGPCIKASDVDKILQQLLLKKEKISALKAEVEFQKVVLGSPDSKRLRMSVPLDKLEADLKTFLGGDPEIIALTGGQETPPAAMATPDSDEEDLLLEMQSDSESDLETSGEAETTDDGESQSESDGENGLETPGPKRKSAAGSTMTPPAKKAKFGTFEFTSQGTWVAVQYDDGKGPIFYIGQVVNIENKARGTVNFLEQCSFKKNSYRFPSSADIDTIDSTYVFDWDFPVSSVNGRTWTLDSFKEVQAHFAKYVKLYC